MSVCRIECLTETGVKTCKGEEREVDVIVCATGFDVSFKPRFVLRGKGGFELGHAWAAEPRSYITVASEYNPGAFSTAYTDCVAFAKQSRTCLITSVS